jgi:L-fucose mutarotase
VISGPVTHPAILSALAGAGHLSSILISDANYPASTTVGPNAVLVHLNLEAGTPSIPHVVELVAKTVPIEGWASMATPEPSFLEVQDQVSKVLGASIPHGIVSREEFYALARSENLALCIVSGDMRRFGNTLLTVGVRLA